MSSKKRTFAEVSQTSRTPHRRDFLPSHHAQVTPWRINTRQRSARSIRHVDARTAQPQSARGILSRLAKLTAPTTKRRIATPTNVSVEKENHKPINEDAEDNTKFLRPTLNFEIEESIDEEDSELPVAPTPSALLDEVSSNDDEPTETFHNLRSGRKGTASDETLGLQIVHSEPDFSVADEEMGPDYETTFLTERGRRAISEEATKMSRYSFGSIHMSGFGSELEIGRESGRPDKHPALGLAEDQRRGMDDTPKDNTLNLGGETEHLRNLRDSPSSDDGNSPGLFVGVPEDNDTFQLDMPDTFEDNVTVNQRNEQGNLSLRLPVVADEEDGDDNENSLEEELQENPSADNETDPTTNQPTAMEAKGKSRKKFKMNKRGNLVPSIPSSLIKRIVHESCRISKKRKISLGKDHMKALEQASEWFFEQISEDLEAYASHGKRKKRIDQSDVLLMMRRQRLLRNDGELREMAKQWLPRKDFEQLDLPDRP